MARDTDHDRIAHKAHELWEAAGRPHGSDQKHWDEAREIIAIEDSQASTLKPRRSGAKPPVEEPAEALRNEGEVPGLTDQGENLLTSTDREPDLVATPAGRKGRMPKAEVPTSDQPGIPPKGRKGAKAKPAATAEDDQPKTASAPAKAASDPAKADTPPAKPASVKSAPAKTAEAKTAAAKIGRAKKPA